jgi:hypothetical protein
MAKLTKHQAHLAARVLAMPADENGWRERPDDITLGESRTLNRWYRDHWIDLEECGSIRIQPAGRRALTEGEQHGDR